MAFLGLLRVVPVWAWALVAAVAWGGYQRHVATSSTKAKVEAEKRAALEVANAEAERQAREQEAQFATNARKAADAYTQRLNQARASATATRTELERLRDEAAATAACPATSDPSASGRPDGAAVLRDVLGECAAALATVAEDADRAEARLSGLQDYVRGVLQSGERTPQPR